MKGNKTRILVLTAFFAASAAACAQIIVPIGPVPISLATFAVLLAGVILGPAAGAASIALYVLIGTMGAPVFSAFRGGFGMLIGPTGGFIAGYIPMAFIAGALYTPGAAGRSVAGMALANAVLYATGTMWYMISTGQGVWSSLLICVIPFIPGDVLKCVGVLLTADRLRYFRSIPAVHR